MRVPIPSLAVLAALVVLAPGPAPAADSAREGQVLYQRRCQRCHTVDNGADTRLGPDLFGIVGKPAGATPTYRHSDVYVKAGRAGLVWSDETLLPYLADPERFLAAVTGDHGAESRMAFKLRSESERRAIIEYLKTLR